MKKAFTKALTLSILDCLKGMSVSCTDANDMAIGVVLMQEGRVIAYEFIKLNNARSIYPIHEKIG